MSLLDYSITEFQVVRRPAFRVAELFEVARGTADRCFVVRDETANRSVLVHSYRLEMLIHLGRLDPDDLAGPSGLLDALAQHQICVDYHQPIGRVVELAFTAEAPIVIVHDGSNPRGLFFPRPYVDAFFPSSTNPFDRPGRFPSSVGASRSVFDESTRPPEELKTDLTRMIHEQNYCGEHGIVAHCPCGREHQSQNTPCGPLRI